jgi:hypothetical protein
MGTGATTGEFDALQESAANRQRKATRGRKKEKAIKSSTDKGIKGRQRRKAIIGKHNRGHQNNKHNRIGKYSKRQQGAITG